MQTRNAVLKRVQAAIEHETRIDLQARAIDMSFSDGVLTLAGEVPDIGTKKRALRAAAAVSEVSGIVDRLRVSCGARPGDGATRDAVVKWLLRDIDFQNCTLRAVVKGRLETLRDVGVNSSGAIEISVADGVVTLAGQVISLSHKRLAGVFAWWARGCRDVVNGLEVFPPQQDNDDEISDALRLALECDPCVHADRIGIGCRDYVVTLEGTVAGDDERRRAEMDAWCLFAVDRVINNLQLG